MQDGKWVLVNASKSDGKHLWIDRVSTNGTVYATQSDETSLGAIGTLDTTTGQFHSLFQDPVAEVANTIWSSDESTLIGVVTAAGAPKVTLVDEAHPDAQLYASLAASFPGQMVDFSSHTDDGTRSEEHTSELQSLMRISYAVFCLKNK